MLGRSQGLLATVRSQSQPGMSTLRKTQSSLLSKGWVGTKMGTVKIMLLVTGDEKVLSALCN
jgi:hypothetical protein